MGEKKSPFKFIASVKGIIVFMGFLLFNILLLSVKKTPFVQQYFQEVFTHTSNFIITSILMGTVSFIWILQGAPFKLVIWLGLVAILMNFAVEIFVTVLNTPDIIDAVYGTAGVVVTVLLMLVFNRLGLKEVVN
ncbi:hypothetical protein [Mucilaginibacter gilvus]|uniref:VanZ-like domain-containing protein n=1 Tax=Mucilaginibacter gilvus TaxID=2305909 RepID=A0A444ML31_9SPHI|nr:hypothetical protein [Mucilaginibacter gilvus]RWY50011.1 hypothetical protein EPL05_14695 [Mucilaginibacter gilvus]